MAAGDELVEEIDGDGRVLRVVTRREMRTANLRHRNVAVVVRRSSGAVVVHQRAAWKDVFPSMWDLAFGGVPGVGEDDRQAAVRELGEEAGVAVAVDDLVDLGRASVDLPDIVWVGRFFAVTTDAPVHPADGEVAQMAEVPIGELPGWADRVDLCPDAGPLLRMVLAGPG